MSQRPKINITRLEQGFSLTQQQKQLQVEFLNEYCVRVRCQLVNEEPNISATFQTFVPERTTVTYQQDDTQIELSSSALKVHFDGKKLTFFKGEQCILTEYARQQSNVRRTVGIDAQEPISPQSSSSLNIAPQVFADLNNGAYQTFQRFESDTSEKIYGLGGYQETDLNKNGGYYELMQRNSQTAIPVYLSNKGYGFLWNNAGVGHVHFAKNQYIWSSNHSNFIEYLVFVGDTPKALMDQYTHLVGRAPMMQERYLGLWQSKLRYQTTQELREVYQQYLQRKIPLSVLVIDYFHWPSEGSFQFDDKYWAGIETLAAQCQQTDTDLMVSVWPTVTEDSPNFVEYRDQRYLITEKASHRVPKLFNDAAILDFSLPAAQKCVQQKLTRNYLDRGIRLFWADQAEPEMNAYQHHHYQVSKGNFATYANQFSKWYLEAIPNESSQPVLIRSVSVGSQAKGALSWSGDIDSSFETLKKQVQVAISMGMSGQAWWTSDIGGFHAYTSDTDYNAELMIRWFQFATFSPILRMHGDRQPHFSKIGASGGGVRTSGSGNEIWSFGTEVEAILTQYTRLREALKPYLVRLYEECHTKGYPLIRPLFMEFPDDETCWKEHSAYMLGAEMVVYPIENYQQQQSAVYLPKGEEWIHLFTQESYSGGNTYRVDSTLDILPVFVKKDSRVRSELAKILQDWRDI